MALTHVEKWAPIQRRPLHLPLPPQSLQILPDPELGPGRRLGQPPELLAEDVGDEFVGEVEFHAGGDGGVDDELRGVVLRGAAGDAVYDGVLVGEGGFEGVGGGVVDGFEGDGRAGWEGEGGAGAGARDGGDGGWGGEFEEFGDEGGADVATGLGGWLGNRMFGGGWGSLERRTPRMAMFLSAGVEDIVVLSGSRGDVL